MTLLEAAPTTVDAAAVMEAVGSTTPYISARLRGNSLGLQVDDVRARLQDRLLREIDRFDSTRGSLPIFAQHLARWVTAEALSRRPREIPIGLTEDFPELPSDATEPLDHLIERDDASRCMRYLCRFAGAEDVERVERAALFEVEPVSRRTQQRVVAVARTVRAAMRCAETAPAVTFETAASCVADFEGSHLALPTLRQLSKRFGAEALTNRNNRVYQAMRIAAAEALADRTGVSVRVAQDRMQNACRLLRVAAAVLEEEGVAPGWL